MNVYVFVSAYITLEQMSTYFMIGQNVAALEG